MLCAQKTVMNWFLFAHLESDSVKIIQQIWAAMLGAARHVWWDTVALQNALQWASRSWGDRGTTASFSHLLSRENNSAYVWACVLMEVYKPFRFSFGGRPARSWWLAHRDFPFDLWVRSVPGLTHFISQLGPAWCSRSPLLLHLLFQSLRPSPGPQGTPHLPSLQAVKL